MRIPPWPVAAAAGVFALLTLGMFATVLVLFVAREIVIGVALLSIVTVLALTAHGLWQGRRGARLVAGVVAAAAVVTGVQRLGEGDLTGLLLLAAVALTGAALTLPRASREWFAGLPR